MQFLPDMRGGWTEARIPTCAFLPPDRPYGPAGRLSARISGKNCMLANAMPGRRHAGNAMSGRHLLGPLLPSLLTPSLLTPSLLTPSLLTPSLLLHAPFRHPSSFLPPSLLLPSLLPPALFLQRPRRGGQHSSAPSAFPLARFLVLALRSILPGPRPAPSPSRSLIFPQIPLDAIYYVSYSIW